MQNKKLFYAACLGFMLLLLAGSALQQRQLDAFRRQQDLVDVAPLKDAPPVVQFTTVALGGFRGLVADYFWLRSQRMQEEGNYYEMYQLASWITKLQPRFTGAISFLAWNMAYNVSVTYQTYEDRWRWVQRGIELLRDEALVYNPGDPNLYFQLGWIYQHKMGQEADDANRYYKTQLAVTMDRVVGGYPVDWKAMAAAPENLAAAMPPPLSLARLLAQANLTEEQLTAQFRERNRLPDSIEKALENQPAARKALILSLRRQWLYQVYKLDPNYILVLHAKYGEVDWRAPEAHSLYWGAKGSERAKNGVDLFCNRMVLQSLDAAFRNGWVEVLSGKDTQGQENESLFWVPNLNVIDSIDRLAPDYEKNFGVLVSKAMRENFLMNAIQYLYTYGQPLKAKEYYNKYNENRKQNGYPKLTMDLETLVVSLAAGDMDNPDGQKINGLVRGYLRQAWLAILFDQDEKTEKMEWLAKKILDNYNEVIGKQTSVRRGLPPFQEYRRNTMLEFYNGLPESMISLRGKLVEARPELKGYVKEFELERARKKAEEERLRLEALKKKGPEEKAKQEAR